METRRIVIDLTETAAVDLEALVARGYHGRSIEECALRMIDQALWEFHDDGTLEPDSPGARSRIQEPE